MILPPRMPQTWASNYSLPVKGPYDHHEASVLVGASVLSCIKNPCMIARREQRTDRASHSPTEARVLREGKRQTEHREKVCVEGQRGKEVRKREETTVTSIVKICSHSWADVCVYMYP